MGSFNHSSGSTLRQVDIAMIVIPTIAVVLRFWSRALPRKSTSIRFWWDDWVILVALPFDIAACVLHLCAVEFGFGRHIETVAPTDVKRLLKVLWVSYFMSDLGIALAKTSCLLFYARIFPIRSRWFQYGLWLGHTSNFLWLLTSIARCLLFCDPVVKFWDTEKPGFCRRPDALYIGNAIPSVVIDIYVLLLPLPIIAGLSMKLGRKLFVSGVFVCGYPVVAISLGRLIVALKMGSLMDKDITYYGVTFIILVAAEPAVSILGCCLPVIFYLVRQGIEKLSPSKQSPNSKSSLKLRWPTSGNYRRERSEQSIELAQGGYTATAASVGYAVGASGNPASKDDASVDDNPVAPVIRVQQDVDVRCVGHS